MSKSTAPSANTDDSLVKFWAGPTKDWEGKDGMFLVAQFSKTPDKTRDDTMGELAEALYTNSIKTAEWKSWLKDPEDAQARTAYIDQLNNTAAGLTAGDGPFSKYRVVFADDEEGKRLHKAYQFSLWKNLDHTKNWERLWACKWDGNAYQPCTDKEEADIEMEIGGSFQETKTKDGKHFDYLHKSDVEEPDLGHLYGWTAEKSKKSTP